jgi:preprotein translocase subunit SecE
MTWPGLAEVQRLTIVVAIFILFALATWGVDEFFQQH